MEKIISTTNKNGEEFSLYQLKILEDNFTYILSQDGCCVSIDPGESAQVENAIKELGLNLTSVLLTHHHHDHVDGAVALKGANKIPILGPKHDSLTFVDQVVVDGDELSLGSFSVKIMHGPGHTLDHVMYFFEEMNLLFCGDVIFLGGCGKMFEGNENQYFYTLEKIKKLPSNTVLLTGHDYYKRNIEFIRFLGKEISEQQLSPADTFHTLEEELAINPFMQVKSPYKFKELYSLREEFRNKQT